MSTITTGKVVIYKPNFNVNPVDTLLDLPVLGAENTLYVIKDTGANTDERLRNSFVEIRVYS